MRIPVPVHPDFDVAQHMAVFGLDPRPNEELTKDIPRWIAVPDSNAREGEDDASGLSTHVAEGHGATQKPSVARDPKTVVVISTFVPRHMAARAGEVAGVAGSVLARRALEECPGSGARELMARRAVAHLVWSRVPGGRLRNARGVVVLVGARVAARTIDASCCALSHAEVRLAWSVTAHTEGKRLFAVRGLKVGARKTCMMH